MEELVYLLNRNVRDEFSVLLIFILINVRQSRPLSRFSYMSRFRNHKLEGDPNNKMYEDAARPKKSRSTPQ